MKFLQRIFRKEKPGDNRNEFRLNLVDRKLEPLQEKAPAPALTQHFDCFRIQCPMHNQRVQDSVCKACPFFGGFRMQRMIQFRSSHGYQYLKFPMPEALAKEGKWKQLPNMRIIYAPESVVCNYPTYLSVEPEWREGFNPNADEELMRMSAEVE